MTYQSQTERGLAVYDCSSCGEPFWAKPETAQRVSSSGRDLLCRECQSLRFLSVSPYPFCRRLTDDEIDDYKFELYRMSRNEDDPISPYSPPPPPPMEKKRTRLDEQVLRLKLHNALVATGVTPHGFGKLANIKNSYLIKNFLADVGIRAKKQTFLQKISDGLEKLAEQHPAREQPTPADALAATPAEPPAAESDLTVDEKIAIIKQLDPSIIKKLFPDL